MSSCCGADEEFLKSTRSRCGVCARDCEAEIFRTFEAPSRVLLRKTCEEHGEQEVCISSDARFYWLAKGSESCCGGNACCASDEGEDGTLGANIKGGTIEQLSTCLALIEIVNTCNLACPTCFADSPVGIVGDKLDAVPVEDLKARIDGVIARKGGIEILQLSGGEPTLHPEFFELLDWVQKHEKIDYLVVNTNGVKIAKDAAFFHKLSEVFRPGRMQLYLQFDGVREEGQRTLRGVDLRETRRLAIERCETIGVPITLAMTVMEENLPQVWATIEFGLRFSNVRGVSFQPMFLSGRAPGQGALGERLNTADIILAAVGQSGGKLRYEDFTPLPCGDPNCATIGYLLKMGEGVRSMSDFIDFSQMQGFLQDKVRYNLEDLAKCGCESEPLGELLKKFELNESSTFRLFIKPFMDSGTWDEDRIDRCCTHVIRPDGVLDSFCRYYATAR